ncbi:MAG TPA: hypothetical protein VHN14_28025 [Kofleriaceae bacterium]|nr:hypothetical protein [Kofleriaceae bacterium]
MPFAFAFAFALGACGDDGARSRDASPDTPIDVPPGTCTSGMFFTGEIIDWDWTVTNDCGVDNSKLTLRGQTAPSDTSNPNGRFELCVPHQAQSLVDVMQSRNASPCHGGPVRDYMGHAVFIAEQAVIDAGGLFSARAMTQARQDEMFTQIGTSYNANQAQLVVHVNGTPRAVSISPNHDATQRYDGTTWAAGDTGSDVFFPNVAPGSVQVTVTGGAIGATMLTLDPGTYTYLAVIAN